MCLNHIDSQIWFFFSLFSTFVLCHPAENWWKKHIFFIQSNLIRQTRRVPDEKFVWYWSTHENRLTNIRGTFFNSKASSSDRVFATLQKFARIRKSFNEILRAKSIYLLAHCFSSVAGRNKVQIYPNTSKLWFSISMTIPINESNRNNSPFSPSLCPGFGSSIFWPHLWDN